MKSQTLLNICLLGALSAFTASAGSISGCGSCAGGVFSLSYTSVASNAVVDTYDVFVSINTADYFGGGSYIHAVSPKIVSTNYVSVLLLTAPATNPNGSTWNNPIDGGLNANGCDGGGAGYFCEQSSGLGAAVANINNSWSWRVTVAHNTPLLVAIDAASLKAEFIDGSGNKTGPVFSEAISLSEDGGTGQSAVPEPSTMVLMGAGLVFAGLLRKRS